MPDAAAIAAARRTGGVLAEVGPLGLAEGYAVAERAYPLLGEPIGWKIGATSAGAMAALGVDAPIRGRMFAALPSPAVLDAPGERACEAEPEIVLKVGEDGRARRAFLGLEVNRPSRDDALALGAGFIVADNAAHVALVLGPELPLALLDDPERVQVTLEGDGATQGGSAAAVLGDPRRALAWLAGAVALRAGELVATGAMCRAVPLPRGGRVVARFGDLGTVEVARPPREVMARHR